MADEPASVNDILAGQPAPESLLAELYDLEHDEIHSDLGFYREWAHRAGGAVIDLGCGSGRLFASLLAGGAARIVGIDGSAALVHRAEERIEADATLREARAAGRIELVIDDVRQARRDDTFALGIMAGVIAHLDGPADALRALRAAGALLEPDGRLIVDGLGPGAMPAHDLPLSVDWERTERGRRIVRRSLLTRHEVPEGLRVTYDTLTDVRDPDGTIARLPASFRLWYPSPTALVALATEADLVVDTTVGSHDLDSLDEESERCIIVLGVRDGRRTD